MNLFEELYDWILSYGIYSIVDTGFVLWWFNEWRKMESWINKVKLKCQKYDIFQKMKIKD